MVGDVYCVFSRLLEEPVVETKRSTVHPQVVYQMPKSTQVYVAPHLHSNSGSGDESVKSIFCALSSASIYYFLLPFYVAFFCIHLGWLKHETYHLNKNKEIPQQKSHCFL